MLCRFTVAVPTMSRSPGFACMVFPTPAANLSVLLSQARPDVIHRVAKKMGQALPVIAQHAMAKRKSENVDVPWEPLVSLSWYGDCSLE